MKLCPWVCLTILWDHRSLKRLIYVFMYVCFHVRYVLSFFVCFVCILYAYIYIYIYIHTCIYLSICIFVCAYIHVYFTCLYLYVCIYMYIHRCFSLFMCWYTFFVLYKSYLFNCLSCGYLGCYLSVWHCCLGSTPRFLFQNCKVEYNHWHKVLYSGNQNQPR